MNPQRRKLMLGLGSLLAFPAVAGQHIFIPTPRQAAGPFYPVELPLDDDNDLTRLNGRNCVARGVISDLSGRMVDINGNPLPNLRIEIWQCDANGRYRHPRENGRQPIDPNFQGHGFNVTDREGQYRFRTIRPVHYPGRTPHIHIAVFPEGEEPFVTQLYVAGEARNETDHLYNSIPWDRRELVTAVFRPANSGDAELQARFNIVLHRHDGTPMQA